MKLTKDLAAEKQMNAILETNQAEYRTLVEKLRREKEEAIKISQKVQLTSKHLTAHTQTPSSLTPIAAWMGEMGLFKSISYSPIHPFAHFGCNGCKATRWVGVGGQVSWR